MLVLDVSEGLYLFLQDREGQHWLGRTEQLFDPQSPRLLHFIMTLETRINLQLRKV